MEQALIFLGMLLFKTVESKKLVDPELLPINAACEHATFLLSEYQYVMLQAAVVLQRRVALICALIHVQRKLRASPLMRESVVAEWSDMLAVLWRVEVETTQNINFE